MERMVPRNDDQRRVKYVFVYGLPRSETSILGPNVARMKDCIGFQNTGVLKDEGRALQDVYLSLNSTNARTTTRALDWIATLRRCLVRHF
jgi:hypothetical protein